MALEFVRVDDDHAEYVTATERLCLTEDRDRLVPEHSPEARWLYCIPGARIPRAEAERLGAIKPEPKPEAKQQTQRQNKQRGKNEDK